MQSLWADFWAASVMRSGLETTTGEAEMRRVVAILLALAPLAYSIGALLYGLLAWGMQCDEICDADSADWRTTSGAWQWSALGALGAVAFLAGILFVASVITRRPVRALSCLAAGAASVGVAISMLGSTRGATRISTCR
jgi:hypothetical protein